MSKPRVKSDKVIVVDLETTCSKGQFESFQNEIIEIGMCVVDMKKMIVEKNVSLYVKPQRSEVTDFCTQLTGITPEDVKDGLPLAEAADLLIKEFQSNEYMWASWGDFDRLIVNREAKHYKARFPFNRQHLNLKAMFGVIYGTDELLSLDAAAKFSNQPFQGEHHRGVDDARTAATLLINMKMLTQGPQ